ncbi:MAG: glutamine synthetase family protein [Lentimicrobiaceae bacterium]|nr:glutamine synthetase family protein [Lentimicrobiaceae bacterium]
MTNIIDMNPNPLVRYLNKPAGDFTRNDLVKFIEAHDIKMINFRFVGGDGRLKTLNFVINSKKHLESILTSGERVDGSSLFSYVEAGSSDLYVIPRYRTAFLNPFASIPTLDILCAFYNKDGEPLASSPQYILRKAHEALQMETGLSFEVMGELEYYIISEQNHLFPTPDQKGYQESTPFNKWQQLRVEAMHAIAQTGGTIKYGHSEVGNFNMNGLDYEQNEIEFLPAPLEDAADQLVVAKWILRSLAYKYGVSVSFAPKITTGKAGSGLHVHTKLVKDGINKMVENGMLNDTAKKAIAGYLYLAPSLTAFGNMNPTSYFRLVPHQEAPTNICWGDRNRSVLVRVPLGWSGANNMNKHANPIEETVANDLSFKQTVEFRCPDGSADIYLLFAGLTVAARHGLQMENALENARNAYVDVNIFMDEHKETLNRLNHLPASCWESAEMLAKQKDIYLKYGVFTPAIIEGIIQRLKNFNDKNLREQIHRDKEKILQLVEQYFHCG